MNIINNITKYKKDNIDTLFNYILSFNDYTFIPAPAEVFDNHEIIIKNTLLLKHQSLLNYDILSRLLYYNPEIIKCIKEDHKDYKKLKELYEFLTI
jgi:hypothetical protein